MRPFTPVAVALALALVGTAACSVDRARQATPATTTTAAPAAPAAPSSCTTPPEANVQSFAPLPVTPANVAAARGDLIRPTKDVLVAGVSADTYLMGFRDPETAAIVGFDIDLVRDIAEALLGDRNKVEFKVITYAQRLPALQNRQVDLVAHTMTINCVRWEQINFSSEYLRAGQRLLVGTDAAARVASLADLAGRRVCVTAGGTSEDNLEEAYPQITAVALPDLTDCMVGFQQGTVDAILSDDTVLAGFAEQDPYAKVVTEGPLLTQEPYGLGLRKDAVALTRVVNGVLDNVRTGPAWRAHHNAWLAEPLGAADPPAPDHSRPLPP